MNHYCLVTELPPRPTVPGPPTLPWAALWERCQPELDEPAQAAIEALRALDGPDQDPAEAAQMVDPRAHTERALGRADETSSAFLQQWVRYEVALREALAARRAAALGRPWSPPAPEIAAQADALASKVDEVMSIAGPLKRQRALDTERLRALSQMLESDEFSTDAVLARVVAALVVDRWDRWPEGEALEEVWM
ncbi:MAG: hypothetical protein AAGF11_30185 [Myxococcota bacterium]